MNDDIYGSVEQTEAEYTGGFADGWKEGWNEGVKASAEKMDRRGGKTAADDIRSLLKKE